MRSWLFGFLRTFRKVALRARLHLEPLEDRAVPSATTLAVSQGESKTFKLTDFKTGDHVTLHVNFRLPDQDDPNENEGRATLKINIPGLGETSMPYGPSDLPFDVPSDEPTLTATIEGGDNGDGDEGAATISWEETTKATLQIQDGKVLVYNPNGSPLPWTTDKIKATVMNLSNHSVTFDLKTQGGGGDVTISPNHFTLKPRETKYDITITAKADSHSANDVVIRLLDEKKKELARDKMTVVGVTIGTHQGNIYDDTTETSRLMASKSAFRIPPGKTTNVPIKLMPSLLADQALTLKVTPSGGTVAGTASIDNGDNVTSDRTLHLHGDAQTSPGSGEGLQVVVQVAGRFTVRSHGFSVSAIPTGGLGILGWIRVNQVNSTHVQSGISGTVGFTAVHDKAGITADGTGASVGELLSGVLFNEQVEDIFADGLYANSTVTKAQTPVPKSYAALEARDFHVTEWKFGIKGLGGVPLEPSTEISNQVYTFIDTRTNSGLQFPIPNTGFQIIKKIIDQGFSFPNRTFVIQTSKAGHAVTANGYTSGTGGGGRAADAITVKRTGIWDPLEVTAPMPSTVLAGQGFGLTIEAHYDNGPVNTSFNGPVTLTLKPVNGGHGVLHGTATVTAGYGVATFAGLNVTAPGTYVLVASAPGLPTLITQPFVVVAAAPKKPAPAHIAPSWAAVTAGTKPNLSRGHRPLGLDPSW